MVGHPTEECKHPPHVWLTVWRGACCCARWCVCCLRVCSRAVVGGSHFFFVRVWISTRRSGFGTIVGSAVTTSRIFLVLAPTNLSHNQSKPEEPAAATWLNELSSSTTTRRCTARAMHVIYIGEQYSTKCVIIPFSCLFPKYVRFGPTVGVARQTTEYVQTWSAYMYCRGIHVTYRIP